MKVEVWADVVCPWCGIGKARLERALADFPHKDEVEVVFHAFQLDPTATSDGVPVREMLKRKYRLTDAQVVATAERVDGLAAAEGLVPFRAGANVTGNTHLAHQLLIHAAAAGKGAAAWDRLFKAYFGDVLPVFTVEQLLPLAAEIGLDVDDVRAALTDGRHAATVARDLAEARQLGITGVPFFVIDRKYGISGAQPLEQFAGALRQAWSERT